MGFGLYSGAVMEVIRFVLQGFHWLDRHSLSLAGALSLALVVWNYWKWQSDHNLALEIREQSVEPVTLKCSPKVSVLVAAWNEEALIERHIRSFLELRYPNKQLILCAGGGDQTYHLASQYESHGVTVLKQLPGQGKQYALRKCFELCGGEIVFLTDADCVLNDEAFEHTLAPLINEGEVAVTGWCAPLPEQHSSGFVLSQWYTDAYSRRHHTSGENPYIDGLLGRNAAVTSRIIEATGSFCDQVLTGTDYYLANQLNAAGYRIRYAPYSVVETTYFPASGDYVKRQARWLRNILLHGRNFGVRAEYRKVLVYAIQAVIVLFSPLLLLVMPRLGMSFLLLLGSYIVFARTRYLRFAEITLNRTTNAKVYLLIPYHFVLDQVAHCLSLVETLLPAFRWRW